MNLVDTHCHLYLPEFDFDREEMLQRADDAGVKKFFLPNIDSASIDSLLHLTSEHQTTCYPMMGLHPCSVKENWKIEIEKIETLLFNSNYKWFGIGETGLDYYWDKTFIDLQKQNFQLHIDWAKQLHLPIIIHSRDSLSDSIEMIKKNKDENLTGIFHCFSGNEEEAGQIIEMNFFLGIGGVVTFKNGGLNKVLEKIPLTHVVLETDSPYLAPAPHRGKRNESSYLKLVVKKIAEVKNISEEEVAAITTANALKVFKIKT
ncbi:MAG: TatD family hydrolase [Chitinophagales bacterium]|nr:TatD family hydrolase [Chitinophagales bacterium]